MTDSSGLRRAYLEFFAARGHTACPSAPIVPQGDATLMFNSAGMVPFKPYFLGLKTDLSRAASSQRCFRTTDIDRVGHTVRHLTFFEMLGNFSFGDYFKEESIPWAWEFLTQDAGLDPKRLHPSIFKDDDEAFALWRKLGTPNAPVRLGEDSNFWNMGPTGPCGPCSEIYFDRGPGFSCGQPSCAVGCDCDRYLEVWNLVFTQFDRQDDGSLKPLPRKNIDTGMGLERLVFAAQNAASPFVTDLFAPIRDEILKITGADPGRPDAELALRVISDHTRAAVMLLSEGIIPSNVDRGYVLRRLIRRALRYGQLLGRKGAFLHRLVPAAAGIYRETVPGLSDATGQIADTMRLEEEKFLETLEKGEAELSAVLSGISGTLPGEQAFKLYETFGFPLELTKEICAKRRIEVDEEGFRKARERAVEVARASWKGSGEATLLGSLAPTIATEFIGYDLLEAKVAVVAAQIDAATGRGVIVLDRTPFYPEGGGQVGDEGDILSLDGGMLAKVIDTKPQGAAILHLVECRPGIDFRGIGHVRARVDAVRRGYISPHHTATHVLNETLRRILGQNVRQAGSYVGADKLRFDFTHPKALGSELLKDVESQVVAEIQRRDAVETRVEPAAKAKEYGAVTLLGEEYGTHPRFVLIGPKGWRDHRDRFSLELCGGTHVANTGDLASFRILRESSVAAGVRRLEAVAGKAVDDFQRQKDREEREQLTDLMTRERELLQEVASLGAKSDELPAAERTAARLRLRLVELREIIGRLKARRLEEAASTGRTVFETRGVRVCAQRMEGADPKNLRSLADRAKSELGSCLVFLASPRDGKLSFVLAATSDLAERGVDAARIAKALASTRGGSAGGRADFAQGGLPDADWEGLVKAVAGLV